MLCFNFITNNTVQAVSGGAPVIAAVASAMDAHNMIATIMKTAAYWCLSPIEQTQHRQLD